MDNLKYLQHKYPISFIELNEYFDRFEIVNFKKKPMKMGRLLNDIISPDGKVTYKRGAIIQFAIRDKETLIAVFKCPVGYTDSGYHEFNIYKVDIIELLK